VQCVTTTNTACMHTCTAHTRAGTQRKSECLHKRLQRCECNDYMCACMIRTTKTRHRNKTNARKAMHQQTNATKQNIFSDTNVTQTNAMQQHEFNETNATTSNCTKKTNAAKNECTDKPLQRNECNESMYACINRATKTKQRKGSIETTECINIIRMHRKTRATKQRMRKQHHATKTTLVVHVWTMQRKVMRRNQNECTQNERNETNAKQFTTNASGYESSADVYIYI